MTIEQVILQKLEELQLQLTAITVVLFVFIATLSLYLYDFKSKYMLRNMANRTFELVLKQTRKLHKIRPKLGGVNSIPDALPILEKFVARYWISTQPRIMDFTESVWLPIIREKNFTRLDWKPLTERWKSYGFLVQKDPHAKTGKGTALIVNPLRINGMERKLFVIASYSPNPDFDMPKVEEMA